MFLYPSSKRPLRSFLNEFCCKKALKTNTHLLHADAFLNLCERLHSAQTCNQPQYTKHTPFWHVSPAGEIKRICSPSPTTKTGGQVTVMLLQTPEYMYLSQVRVISHLYYPLFCSVTTGGSHRNMAGCVGCPIYKQGVYKSTLKVLLVIDDPPTQHFLTPILGGG